MTQSTLKERNLTFLLMKTLTDLIKNETDEARKALMTELLDSYRETGNKSFSVMIPGAEKVATLTLAEPKPEVKISDQEAFLEWCRINRPHLTEVVEHPAVEAWTETRLSAKAIDVISGESVIVGCSLVTQDGEPVDGVEYVPAAEPKSFSVRYVTGGQQRIVQAWKTGELAAVVPGQTLPQIGMA